MINIRMSDASANVISVGICRMCNEPACSQPELFVKALIRLQVLTPLSTLVHIATVLATQFVVSPTLSEITKQRHRTSITPQPSLVGVFLIILWALQLGYTFLLVGAW